MEAAFSAFHSVLYTQKVQVQSHICTVFKSTVWLRPLVFIWFFFLWSWHFWRLQTSYFENVLPVGFIWDMILALLATTGWGIWPCVAYGPLITWWWCSLYHEVTFPCEPESCGELCPLSCLFSPHSEFPCALILVALWGLNLKCTDCCCCRLVLPVLASCPRRQLSFTQLGLSQCLLSFWHKMPRCCLGFLPVCLKSTIFPRNWFSL